MRATHVNDRRGAIVAFAIAALLLPTLRSSASAAAAAKPAAKSTTARTSARPAAASAGDRARPPKLPPPPPLRLPAIQTQMLPNGLELDVVEMHKTPVVDVTVLLRAGAVRDPESDPGLATFTADMLDEGAGERTALAISEEADFLGATFGVEAGLETADASIHVPKRQLGAALDLLADVVLRPTFPDSEIARQRKLRQEAILQLRDQPTAISPIAFNAIVFGAGHPYGRPVGGTEASAAALDRKKVAEFYNTYYRPGNARVLIVGDVSASEARSLIEARFAGWTKADVPPLLAATPPPPAARTIYLVDKPGAAQSVMRIGQVGVARNTPDYFPLTVLNTILGGSFTSRLNQNLRETHGYSYGASSTFEMRRLAGPFRAAASVVTAKTDSALVEFMKELRRIRDVPVPTAELEKAKAYVTLSLPGQFEATADAAGQFRDVLVNDLPRDFYNHYSEGVRAVTAKDVQRVARQYLDPDHFAIVIVGDRSAIEPGLKALNLGPIVIRDLWGQDVAAK